MWLTVRVGMIFTQQILQAISHDRIYQKNILPCHFLLRLAWLTVNLSIDLLLVNMLLTWRQDFSNLKNINSSHLRDLPNDLAVGLAVWVTFMCFLTRDHDLFWKYSIKYMDLALYLGSWEMESWSSCII